MTSKGESESDSKDPTILDLMHNVRTGQLTTGPRKPLTWLEYSRREKTDQEMKIEGVMESCTFKAIMSCVVGMQYSISPSYNGPQGCYHSQVQIMGLEVG